LNALIRYFGAHRGARRGLSVFFVLLILGSVGLLGYPLFTNLYERWVQHRLGRQIKTPELAERYRTRTLGDGDALTDIKIPKLGVDTTVVEGISASALRAGAGHYPETPLPCEEGNVAIAGHRTTYGKPFADVDRLTIGDTIVLETPVGACTYEVFRPPFVVHPREWSVVANTPATRNLTLTTCHPKGTARERLVVQARLVPGTEVRT
jgi:sortase A